MNECIYGINTISSSSDGMYPIVFIKLKNGKRPVSDFLDELDLEAQCKVHKSLALLSELGYHIREPYSKSLLQGLFELRIPTDHKAIRLLYFYSSQSIVITHGFVKKTQRTPIREIHRALKLRKAYRESLGEQS